MTFRYLLRQGWPPLSWVAHCDPSTATITVTHGAQVETSDDWFCEAVWAGPYEAGDFDATDVVFGSGGRIRDGRAVFVSSMTTVDRLHFVRTSHGAVVSNSLVGLCATTGATLNPASARYYELLGSITRGLHRYERSLPSSIGPIHIVYVDNVMWNGSDIVRVAKPNPQRDFGRFAAYRAFLDGTLGQIAANMSAERRRHRYTFLGTLSSGYDSTTVATLARAHGLEEVVSFTQARGGDADDGRPVAELLGVRVTTLSRDAWRERPFPETPFMAADAKGEDVFFCGAEASLAKRVVLTGFHGDKVWSKDPPDSSDNLVRGDRSGLSLSEYRLWTGFVHVSVPFIGARQIREITAISNSTEMAPWDVAGDYSRPICRRIVEEAGIPRHLFGTSKKAASVVYGFRTDVLTAQTQGSVDSWLRERLAPWALSSASYARIRLFSHADKWCRPILRDMRLLARQLPGPLASPARTFVRMLDSTHHAGNPLRYIFPWAVERAKQRYT